MEEKEKQNNRGKSLAVGTLIYALGSLGTKIISFLIVPLYTYYIATEDMGDFDLILTTVSLLAPLITLRISDAAYRWMLHKIESNEKCISNTYLVMIVTSIIVPIIICLFNLVVPIPYVGYFILIIIVSRWYDTLQFLLRGLNNQKLFAVSGIIHTLIYVTMNLVQIVGLHQGIEALLQSNVISSVTVIIMLLIFEPRLRVYGILKRRDVDLIKQMIKYSAPLIPSGLCWWVMGASDRYVIRIVLGRSATGIYAVANKFPTIVSTLFTFFNYSWTDIAISSLSEGKETSEYSSKLFEKLYIISFSFILCLIPATKLVSTWILSEAYRTGAIYIGFLYLGSLFHGFTTFISAGMLQRNETKLIARSSTIGAVVNLAFDIFTMHVIGLHAASISTFLGAFVMWYCRMRDCKNISPIDIDKRKFGILFVLTLAMAAISIWSTMTLDMVLTVILMIAFLMINKDTLKSMVSSFKKRSAH